MSTSKRSVVQTEVLSAENLIEVSGLNQNPHELPMTLFDECHTIHSHHHLSLQWRQVKIKTSTRTVQELAYEFR